MTPKRLQQIIELERSSRPWPKDVTTFAIAARQALRDLLDEVQGEHIERHDEPLTPGFEFAGHVPADQVTITD